MYLQIENEFKENSRIRSSQILFIVGAILGKNDYQALLDAIGGPVCHSGFARLLK